MKRSSTARRVASAHLNALIDAALDRPARDRVRALLAAAPPSQDLFERVRHRAAAVAKQKGARALVARDRIMRTLYASMLGAGWHAGWSDASVSEEGASGIGGLMADPGGRVLFRIREPVSSRAVFEAEIAAAATLADAGVRHGVTRLRLYTDCRALVELWQRRRKDRRLATLRAAVHGLRQFELRALPRLHNQPANRLARAAAFRAAGVRPRAQDRHAGGGAGPDANADG